MKRPRSEPSLRVDGTLTLKRPKRKLVDEFPDVPVGALIELRGQIKGLRIAERLVRYCRTHAGFNDLLHRLRARRRALEAKAKGGRDGGR